MHYLAGHFTLNWSIRSDTIFASTLTNHESRPPHPMGGGDQAISFPTSFYPSTRPIHFWHSLNACFPPQAMHGNFSPLFLLFSSLWIRGHGDHRNRPRTSFGYSSPLPLDCIPRSLLPAIRSFSFLIFLLSLSHIPKFLLFLSLFSPFPYYAIRPLPLPFVWHGPNHPPCDIRFIP